MSAITVLNTCPTCHRKITRPKSSVSDKKFREDQGKAQVAIGVLERAIPTIVPDYTPVGYGEGAGALTKKAKLARDQFAVTVRESIVSEINRLKRAINEPALLWAIYRRKEKGISGYAQPALRRAA